MSLTNTQYDTLMRGYQARQTENQHRIEQRQQEVYTACPELKDVEDSIASISVKRARMLLDGDESALSALRQELNGLMKQKALLLAKAGYPADYLKSAYHCPDCRDTGYIGNEKCHCFKQAAIDLVYTQSNLRQILERENFAYFSLDYYSEEELQEGSGLTSRRYAQRAHRECLRFVREFDESFDNLLLYGDTGVGKTFLSNCVAKELLDTGHSVIYFTAFELFHMFEEAAFHGKNGSNDAYQNLFDCDLLIIDDLGTELTNSFTTSQLFLCLNERILRRRSTIISTNLSLQALADTYTERTFSRITSCYTTLKLVGTDIRVMKKLNQR